MFTRIMDKTTRSVKFEYAADNLPGEPPTWTIGQTASYAPGWEHLRGMTLRVKSVGITLFREKLSNPWEARGVVIETESAPDGTGTIVLTVDPDDVADGSWLAFLISLAVSW